MLLTVVYMMPETLNTLTSQDKTWLE